MGCDIHIVAQRRNASGDWEDVTGSFHEESDAPFNWRSYGLYGFLAGVRNYSAVTPISKPRGEPEDLRDRRQRAYDQALERTGGFPSLEYDDFDDNHSHSWLSVAELAAYDYEQVIEDRRVTIDGNGACTAPVGGGRRETLREFLGTAFFDDLAELQRIGAERIVFSFDN